MTTHCSILAWKIPWTEEPGRLQSVGSQRARNDWVNKQQGILEISKSSTPSFIAEETEAQKFVVCSVVSQVVSGRAGVRVQISRVLSAFLTEWRSAVKACLRVLADNMTQNDRKWPTCFQSLFFIESYCLVWWVPSWMDIYLHCLERAKKHCCSLSIEPVWEVSLTWTIWCPQVEFVLQLHFIWST